MTVKKYITVITLFLTLILAPPSQAQNNPFPNELEGFKFFLDGKLKGLQLGVSTKEDVTGIFGKDCEYSCDYNADWTITFNYYDSNSTKEITTVNNEKALFYIDSKYIGTLSSIQLQPKKQFSFSVFPFQYFQRHLKELQSTPIQKVRGRIITYEIYEDADGLKYELYGKTNYDNLNNQKLNDKGDLSSIIYTIPEEQEKSMFSSHK